MAIHATIIYADGNARRTNDVVKILQSAGHTVYACTGKVTPAFSGRPDLVLLHHEIADELRLLVETLWPSVPCRIVQRTHKEDLIALVDSA